LLEITTPERVCDGCYQNIQSQSLSSVFQNHNLQPQGASMNEDGNNNNNNSLAGHGSYSKF
jgi:hypothetical protein